MSSSNIIMSETYHRPIVDMLDTKMPDRRPVGDQRASTETHRRPTCLTRDPSETDITLPHCFDLCALFLLIYPANMNHSGVSLYLDSSLSSSPA